ncbi:MAG: xanthine dehydrogenase family protein molybdopterin-binding subunit [Nitrososphaerota archaeon]
MYKHIGRSAYSGDQLKHCLGRARFVGDIKMDSMLHCSFVRSPYPHALIRSVMYRSGLTVLTWEKLEKICRPFKVEIPLRDVKPYALHYLANRKVRFVGEPVAAVLSDDFYRLEDFLDEVAVDYEPLPAVTNVMAAQDEDAPLLYEEWGDNVAASLSLRVGDVGRAMEDSHLVLDESFSIGRAAPTPLESRAILAHYDSGTRQLTVFTSNQAPHVEKALLSTALGIPESRVRVVTPDVGGAFGQKCLLYPEDVTVCLASMITGRPVKWVENRRENLTAASHAREQHHRIRVGASDEGEILAVSDEIITDIGAGILYPHSSIGTSIVTASMLPGPYKFRNYEARIRCVVTNKCPFGAYRGFGQPEATLVMERVVELIARELGMEAYAVRMVNMVSEADIPFVSVSGTLIESGNPQETLRTLLSQTGYERLKSQEGGGVKIVGVGIACNTETTVPSLTFQTGKWGATEQASVAITPEGSVVVRSGAVSMGTGLATTLAQVAADELGQRIEDVEVRLGDTDSTPFSTGLWGSRGCAMVGTAVQMACRTIKAKVFKIAATLLDANPNDLEMKGDRIQVRGHMDRFVSLKEVARIAYNEPHKLPERMEPGLEMTASYEAPNISRAPDSEGRLNVSGATTNAAHLAVVELDMETGEVRLLAYYVSHDSGVSVNPAIVDGQVLGGLAQSIGSTLYEEIRYSEDGHPLTTTFIDYLIPGAVEMPTVVVFSSERPSPVIPLGVKGVGESGTIAAPAAIVNAVENALLKAGIRPRLTSVPIYPHQIWKHLPRP